MAFTMCDGSDYVTARFLFIHWAVDGEKNVLYMSFNTIECIKRSKYMVVAQILKNNFSFLKQFKLVMNNK